MNIGHVIWRRIMMNDTNILVDFWAWENTIRVFLLYEDGFVDTIIYDRQNICLKYGVNGRRLKKISILDW